MKRSKSGAQKRKEAATARDAVAKLPKMTDFLKITEQSRPGTSTERDEENYSVQEKEDYDDQHQSDCEFPENVSCDLPANTQPSISKITESRFTLIPDDPCKWPESISDAQRCDIVKRGPHQLIMNFPYNNTTPRRRFSSNHYKRVLPNGESVSRSWLVYSGESDQVFCFCCKLFGKTLSPFCMLFLLAALLTCCKEFQKKFGDIDSDEMSAELQRFCFNFTKKTQSQYGSRLSELSSKDSFI